MLAAVLNQIGDTKLEFAGDVVEVGADVRSLKVGDRALISFVPPCGECALCTGGQPHLCMVYPMQAFAQPRFTVGGVPAFGLAGTGTFAEELVVPHQGAVKVADDVPYEIAALIACGVLTGVGAVLNTAAVPSGATAVVFGCGGVGISVLQGLRIAGAVRIVAVDPIVSKHAVAIRFGATDAVTPDQLAEVSAQLTGGSGFDFGFDVVGRSETIRAAFDNTRRGGATVVVGAGRSDDMVQFSAQELFVMERRILGSFYGSADVRRDVDKLLGFWRGGQLELEPMISRRLKLTEVNEALDALRAGGQQIRQVVTFE